MAARYGALYFGGMARYDMLPRTAYNFCWIRNFSFAFNMTLPQKDRKVELNGFEVGSSHGIQGSRPWNVIDCLPIIPRLERLQISDTRWH